MLLILFFLTRSQGTPQENKVKKAARVVLKRSSSNSHLLLEEKSPKKLKLDTSTSEDEIKDKQRESNTNKEEEELKSSDKELQYSSSEKESKASKVDSSSSKRQSKSGTITDFFKSTSESKQKKEENTNTNDGKGSIVDYLVEPSWRSILQSEFKEPYFQTMLNKINKDKEAGFVIYPPEHEMFSAFNLTPLHSIKVVILGQDPYHGPGQAHGLAFSVKKGVAVPPSLKSFDSFFSFYNFSFDLPFLEISLKS